MCLADLRPLGFSGELEMEAGDFPEARSADEDQRPMRNLAFTVEFGIDIGVRLGTTWSDEPGMVSGGRDLPVGLIAGVRDDWATACLDLCRSYPVF